MRIATVLLGVAVIAAMSCEDTSPPLPSWTPHVNQFPQYNGVTVYEGHSYHNFDPHDLSLWVAQPGEWSHRFIEGNTSVDDLPGLLNRWNTLFRYRPEVGVYYKTPSEFWVDLEGDCEDGALFVASVLFAHSDRCVVYVEGSWDGEPHAWVECEGVVIDFTRQGFRQRVSGDYRPVRAYNIRSATVIEHVQAP